MRVNNEIHIYAPVETVWSVTTDVERWPEWTPTVTSVRRLDSGPLRPGSVARIVQPMQPAADWTVIEFEPGKRFAWETRRPGMHLVGTHEINPVADGTRNVLRLEARGALAVLLWPVLGLAVGRALAAENRGLKARCERLVGEDPARNRGPSQA